MKDWMLNEKFTFYFKTAIKWNLTESHATRWKAAKNKTHVIKEHLLKWMSYNQMKQSYSLSYDESLFLSYQKVPCLFLLNREWSLLIKRLSIRVTLKSLLLVVRIKIFSKWGEWLQNKRCSLMVEPLSPLILFSVSADMPNCSHILTLKWCLALP